MEIHEVLGLHSICFHFCWICTWHFFTSWHHHSDSLDGSRIFRYIKTDIPRLPDCNDVSLALCTEHVTEKKLMQHFPPYPCIRRDASIHTSLHTLLDIVHLKYMQVKICTLKNIDTHRACWCHCCRLWVNWVSLEEGSQTSSGCIVSLYPLRSWQHKTRRAPPAQSQRHPVVDHNTHQCQRTSPHQQPHYFISKLPNFPNPKPCLVPHSILISPFLPRLNIAKLLMN